MIMKLKGFIFTAVAAVMAFAACQKTEDLGSPDIKLSVSQLAFEQNADSKEIEILATRDWSVEIPADADWVVVDPEFGVASSSVQAVTVSVLANEGVDRTATLKFKIGTKSKSLKVTQKGPEGSADDLIMYTNNFDAKPVEKVSGSFPLLADSYDVWDNKKGKDVANVSYEFGGKMSVRNSGKASNADGYTSYAGSGVNKIFFGTGPTTFKILNISLDPAVANYRFSFGGNKYGQENPDNNFSFDEFKVYLSLDTQKWAQVNVAFPEGVDIDSKWNQASANITVPEGTTAISVAFTCSASSLYSIDDVLLEYGTEAGLTPDFANGVALGGASGGNTGGGSSTELPEGTGEGTEASPYDAAKAQRLASALGKDDKTTGVYVKGKVKSIKELSTSFGNATYYITDATGAANFYIYRGKNVGNTSFTSADQLKEGDEVVVYGDLMNYMGDSPQLGQGNYIVTLNAGSGSGNEGGETPQPIEKPTTLVKATIKEFLAAAEDDTWYELTGEIVSIVAGNKYGNFTIKDETASVYIYGMTSQWVGKNDQSFESLGLKVTDVVTLGTRRASNPNNGVAQGGGSQVPAYYISHVPGAGVPADPTGTIELTFSADTQESIGTYTSDWTATIGSNSWRIVNFNNNNNKWTYIKCGHKTTANVATIANKNSYTAAIKKVVVSVDQVLNTSKVSTKLEVATDESFTNIVETVNATIAVGDVEYVVSSPQVNCYYRLTFDNQALGGNSNGNVQISKVKYVPTEVAN